MAERPCLRRLLATFSGAPAFFLRPFHDTCVCRLLLVRAARARAPSPTSRFNTEMSTRAVSNRADLAIQIESLIARLHPAVERERRRDDRIAIPVLFRLTPYDADRLPLDELSTIVVGKNISRRGLSFFHENPLPQRRGRIQLVHPGLVSFAAEIDISWCRFTKPGWYESGGRLVRAFSDSDQPESDKLPQFLLPTHFLVESAAALDLLTECRI